jgi:hypothetical protein
MVSLVGEEGGDAGGLTRCVVVREGHRGLRLRRLC